MEIYTVDSSLIARGQAAFKGCVSQSFGGKTPEYREGGVAMIPGAIVSAMEMGFESEDEIARVVARATRCWDSTVATMLVNLANPRVANRLWECRDGKYRLVESDDLRPFMVIAV